MWRASAGCAPLLSRLRGARGFECSWLPLKVFTHRLPQGKLESLIIWYHIISYYIYIYVYVYTHVYTHIYVSIEGLDKSHISRWSLEALSIILSFWGVQNRDPGISSTKVLRCENDRIRPPPPTGAAGARCDAPRRRRCTPPTLSREPPRRKKAKVTVPERSAPAKRVLRPTGTCAAVLGCA